jgi:hypothetical protein
LADGDYYPFVGKAWEAAAGKTNNLAAGTGEIFLPFIRNGTLQPVSATNDTVITFSSAIISNNPALAGVHIVVPANALFSDNGARGGKVGIAPVPPDRLPEPLPPGLEMPIVITVQTDGGLNFDRPAPVCFPNLPDPVLKTPLPREAGRRSIRSITTKDLGSGGIDDGKSGWTVRVERSGHGNSSTGLAWSWAAAIRTATVPGPML